MTGKRVNAQQIKIYMTQRIEGETQRVAAAKSGFSEATACNLKKRGFTEAKATRHWRTRVDPLAEIWDSKIVPLLEKSPHLQARTILEELQRESSDKYPDSLLRTLHRRVREWRALSGPEKEVIFRQTHPPGLQGMSDFTNCNALKVTLKEKPLEHLLYHYRLVYSTWEAASVVLGGESFSALAEGMQNALWCSGGAPETHRTDSLSAAYKNCSNKEREEFTEDYLALCAHYQMEPTRNNKGVAHENGAIESSHRDLKNRIDQALMLRGSRDFSTIEEYRHFVQEVVERHNRKVQKRYAEELGFLKKLPERRTTDFREERIRVTTGSTIRVCDVIYSVPSRLIGMLIKVHLYDDRLECFVGGDAVVKLERKRRSRERVHQIDYRHVIGALRQKPQAFRNYIYREELFPALAFRETWERLNKELTPREACSDYVKILSEAAEGTNEAVVIDFLERQLQKNTLPRARDVQKLFRTEREPHRLKEIACDLENYDEFLEEDAE